MRRRYLLLLIAAVSMILLLAGCGSKSGSSGESTEEAVTEEAASPENEATTEEAVNDAAKELKWLTYDLKLEELRDMDDSDHFSVKDAPEGSRYVVIKLLCTDGEIKMDDIKEDNTKSLILKDPYGGEYEPGLWAIWGIEYDAKKGFSTKETQEGFQLLYVVPQDIEAKNLSLELR
ncbi:MAG: hypothetical protein IKX76_03410 [Eubacterium sp.]|nr:hypothetical protein [Eubacterium sp.]